jgi:hypothetical protein
MIDQTGMSRMFTDEQLQEISEPLCDKAIRALKSEDLITVKGLLNEMANGPSSLNALGIPILTQFFNEFLQDFGEDTAKMLMERIGRNLLKTMIKDYRSGDEKLVISDIVSIFRYQPGVNIVPVKESSDEIVYDLVPCGSGGRLALDGHGLSPYVHGTWSDGVNSFCQFCKASQRAFNKAVGCEAWTTEISNDVPGRCTMRFRKTLTRGFDLFTTEELYNNAKGNIRKAMEKLDAGDLNIESLISCQHREWLPWHDFLCATIGYLFGTCYVERGVQYLDDKLKAAYDPAFAVFYPYYHAMNDEQNLRSLCVLHHYHIMDFTLTEEEDRFVFKLDPCGSGGRLYRGEFWRDMFHYGGEISPLMKEEHVVNFHRMDFPVYCTHCSSHNRDQFSKGCLWFINDGHAQSQPGKPCVQYYYKKSKGISTSQVDPKLRAQVDM